MGLNEVLIKKLGRMLGLGEIEDMEVEEKYLILNVFRKILGMRFVIIEILIWKESLSFIDSMKDS